MNSQLQKQMAGMDLTDPAVLSGAVRACLSLFFFFFGDKTTQAHKKREDVRREEGRVKWSRGQAWEE